MTRFCKHWLPILLVLLMLAGALSACKSQGNSGTTTTNRTNSTSEPSSDNGDDGEDTDVNGYLNDSLPKTYNFDSDFVIYSWEDQKTWEWTTDTDKNPNDRVASALFKRQAHVEDRFGVTIKLIYQPGSWSARNQFIKTLANSVNTNQHEYDLVGQYTPAAGIGATQGLYANLNEVENLNLEKPWWPSSISRTCTVGDKLLFVTGDITPTLIRNIQCMFVNLDMYDALSLSDYTDGRSIYDVVREGDWTLEMLKTLAIGRVGNTENTYGMTIASGVSADPFFYGGGFTLVENTDGVLTLSDSLKSEALYGYFDEVKKMFIGAYSDIAMEGEDPFTERRAIFEAATFTSAQTFTEKGLRFSVLPQPKLNKDQLNYATCASFWVTMYSVPVDADSTFMSGMILEALGSEAYRTVTDELYYEVFQKRYSASDNVDSAAMYDYLSGSVVFDAARFFTDYLGMYAAFRGGVNDSSDPNGSWSTIYSGNKDAWNLKINSLYSKVQ